MELKNRINQANQKAIEILFNLGLTAFADSYVAQGVPVTHVDFHPPARGDEALAKLLSDML